MREPMARARAALIATVPATIAATISVVVFHSWLLALLLWLPTIALFAWEIRDISRDEPRRHDTNA